MHLVGVGGAGMSAYARAAHALGATRQRLRRPREPLPARRLRADGVLDAHVGHAAENLPAGEGVELYYSSAVPAENPERAARPRARHPGVAPRPACSASSRR